MSLLRALLRPAELAFVYLGIRAAPQRSIHDILVSCSSTTTDCGLFFQRCVAALDLLRAFDRRRFERLRRDVRGIALTTRGGSYYDHSLRHIFLDVDLIHNSPEYIAATLVHEATHARIYHAGVRNYSAQRDRHERLCISQEIAFASRLPGAEALVERISEGLRRPWWNEHGRQVAVRRFVRRHGLPRWFERFLLRFGAR